MLLTTVALKATLLAAMIATVPPTTTEDLLAVWRAHRVTAVSPPCLKHQDVQAAIDLLAEQFGQQLQVEQVGSSFEGRSIRLLTLGRGERKILLWSQMHGDEASATPAVLDLVNYLLRSSESGAAVARRILDEFTLLIVPMLNPDGTERATRRSAQGIDINRDARQLATPEGRLLKQLRDQHQPFLGFNLHDQDRSKLVGDTDVLATQSVLAVAGDAAQTVTDGRRRAMRVAAALADTFRSVIPGGVGRYDEDWSERSFGDNLTAWGTPIVLMESGGMPEGEHFSFLSALTFAGLVRALDELARNDAADFTVDGYRSIPSNRSDGLVDVIMRGAAVLRSNGKELRASRSDVAFDVQVAERALACASPDESESLVSLRQRGVGHQGSSIQELGDARLLFAARTDAAEASILLPLLRIGIDGYRADDLLSAWTLGRWTSLGVGEVVWRVKPRDWSAASDHARALAGIDLASVRIVLEAAFPTLVAKSGLNRVDDGRTTSPVFSDALEEILGEPVDEGALAKALLEARNLSRFGAASFLVLNRSENRGQVPLESPLHAARVGRLAIQGVWLDGRQVSQVDPQPGDRE